MKSGRTTLLVTLLLLILPLTLAAQTVTIQQPNYQAGTPYSDGDPRGYTLCEIPVETQPSPTSSAWESVYGGITNKLYLYETSGKACSDIFGGTTALELNRGGSDGHGVPGTRTFTIRDTPTEVTDETLIPIPTSLGIRNTGGDGGYMSITVDALKQTEPPLSASAYELAQVQVCMDRAELSFRHYSNQFQQYDTGNTFKIDVDGNAFNDRSCKNLFTTANAGEFAGWALVPRDQRTYKLPVGCGDIRIDITHDSDFLGGGCDATEGSPFSLRDYASNGYKIELCESGWFNQQPQLVFDFTPGTESGYNPNTNLLYSYDFFMDDRDGDHNGGFRYTVSCVNPTDILECGAGAPTDMCDYDLQDCVAGSCVQKSCTDIQLQPGYENWCVDSNGEGYTCDDNTGQCVAPQCTVDTDCASGEVCENNQCVKKVAKVSPPPAIRYMDCAEDQCYLDGEGAGSGSCVPIGSNVTRNDDFYLCADEINPSYTAYATWVHQNSLLAVELLENYATNNFFLNCGPVDGADTVGINDPDALREQGYCELANLDSNDEVTEIIIGVSFPKGTVWSLTNRIAFRDEVQLAHPEMSDAERTNPDFTAPYMEENPEEGYAYFTSADTLTTKTGYTDFWNNLYGLYNNHRETLDIAYPFGEQVYIRRDGSNRWMSIVEPTNSSCVSGDDRLMLGVELLSCQNDINVVGGAITGNAVMEVPDDNCDCEFTGEACYDPDCGGTGGGGGGGGGGTGGTGGTTTPPEDDVPAIPGGTSSCANDNDCDTGEVCINSLCEAGERCGTTICIDPFVCDQNTLNCVLPNPDLPTGGGGGTNTCDSYEAYCYDVNEWRKVIRTR